MGSAIQRVFSAGPNPILTPKHKELNLENQSQFLIILIIIVLIPLFMQLVLLEVLLQISNSHMISLAVT